MRKHKCVLSIIGIIAIPILFICLFFSSPRPASADCCKVDASGWSIGPWIPSSGYALMTCPNAPEARCYMRVRKCECDAECSGGSCVEIELLPEAICNYTFVVHYQDDGCTGTHYISTQYYEWYWDDTQECVDLGDDQCLCDNETHAYHENEHTDCSTL